jgi:hypothetical protein
MGADRNVRASKSSGDPSSPGLSAKRPFGAPPRGAAGARFSRCEELGAILDGLIGEGDAILLARTADGGAISITLMRDNRREKSYPVSQEELNFLMDWLKDEYIGG